MIDYEHTSLSDWLSVEDILKGEDIEFDPEPKTNRKQKYVLYDFAFTLINAAVKDLKDAYEALDEITERADTLEEQLKDAEDRADNSTNQLKKVLKNDEEFVKAEKLLARVENQIVTLTKDRDALTKENKNDKQLIQKLQAEVNELIHLRDEVPMLRDEVQMVIDNLRGYLADAGIVWDDEDDDL